PPSNTYIYTLSLHDALPIYHVHQAVATLELGPVLGTAVKLAEKTIKPSYNNIITVSQETKHQIEKQLGVEGSRIHVVYHGVDHEDRKSTRLNSSHVKISYAV